jgi:hypothetical protein
MHFIEQVENEVEGLSWSKKGSNFVVWHGEAMLPVMWMRSATSVFADLLKQTRDAAACSRSLHRGPCAGGSRLPRSAPVTVSPAALHSPLPSLPLSSSSLEVDRDKIPKAAADREMRMGFDL